VNLARWLQSFDCCAAAKPSIGLSEVINSAAHDVAVIGWSCWVGGGCSPRKNRRQLPLLTNRDGYFRRSNVQVH
jgi:hypothetical protein